MKVFKRLLAASGAAGLLIGLGGATQAFAAAPFTAEIALNCVNAGQTQTIRVNAGQDSLVNIDVSIGGSTVNGGTQNGTGIPDANGTFTDAWQVAAVSAATQATVRIYVFTSTGVASGNGSFTVHAAADPCMSPAPVRITGTFIDVTQVGGSVKKTCDTGVTGNATFIATIQLKVDTELLTTVTVPVSLTLACNGAAESLPMLPPTSVVTLHESVLPAGAAALAADTKITIGTSAATTTIHNTKKPAVVVVLPATGQPASGPVLPWPAIALLGLIALGGAGLVLRRRS